MDSPHPQSRVVTLAAMRAASVLALLIAAVPAIDAARAEGEFQMAQYRDPSFPVPEGPPSRFGGRDSYDAGNRTPFALPTAPVQPAQPASADTSGQASGPGSAAGGEEEAAGASSIPPYSTELLRLSEILGSMHYLRPLCGAKEDQVWRSQMQSLLQAENAGGTWKLRLINSFNQGFHTFERSYRYCTPSATLAVSRYMEEGEKIAQIIKTRYAD